MSPWVFSIPAIHSSDPIHNGEL